MQKAKIKYKDYDAIQFSSGSLELIVTTSCGPRVISLKSKKAKQAGNFFFEFPRPEKRYLGLYLRGGHRLWHAPEDLVDTYVPDDETLSVKALKNGASFKHPVEKKTGLQKSIQVELLKNDTVKVTHVLKNKTRKPIERAAWAVTMLPPGGYGFFPLLPKGSHAGGDLLPNTVLIPWTFTDFSSKVWHYNRDFIGVNVDQAKEAQKLGIYNYPGWSGYWRKNAVFIKYSKPNIGKAHTDMGATFETFTNGSMYELETLSDFRVIKPGKAITHVEYWTVFSGVKKPNSDKRFDQTIKPRVARWLKTLTA
jgi:hypothetical protein